MKTVLYSQADNQDLLANYNSEEAVQEIAVEKITLLTDNNEGDLNIGGINKKVQSVTEWLLK